MAKTSEEKLTDAILKENKELKRKLERQQRLNIYDDAPFWCVLAFITLMAMAAVEEVDGHRFGLFF